MKYPVNRGEMGPELRGCLHFSYVGHHVRLLHCEGVGMCVAF